MAPRTVRSISPSTSSPVVRPIVGSAIRRTDPHVRYLRAPLRRSTPDAVVSRGGGCTARARRALLREGPRSARIPSSAEGGRFPTSRATPRNRAAQADRDREMPYASSTRPRSLWAADSEGGHPGVISAPDGSSPFSRDLENAPFCATRIGPPWAVRRESIKRAQRGASADTPNLSAQRAVLPTPLVPRRIIAEGSPTRATERSPTTLSFPGAVSMVELGGGTDFHAVPMPRSFADSAASLFPPEVRHSRRIDRSRHHLAQPGGIAIETCGVQRTAGPQREVRSAGAAYGYCDILRSSQLADRHPPVFDRCEERVSFLAAYMTLWFVRGDHTDRSRSRFIQSAFSFSHIRISPRPGLRRASRSRARRVTPSG